MCYDDGREISLESIMRLRKCGRAEAEVLLRRIDSRLAGYTHAEVVVLHPLPSAATNLLESLRSRGTSRRPDA